ncbi:short-chain fatty acyl-CoA regulator family protein [Aminobacter aminovorans]|uniref:helix-turn-helix domain-containing protein n=1 Tax=Aminobacter aminovorans TaxID=83263 RepID=UPI00286608BD|nr:short-chain fatty acyl-CoA regulator family protein [Aminobacter aminovorans]MDR7223626.1 putative transcriptional regulator/transcriptional regulator with XRE-family HTH domain [Aminobacter aminovorans]
MATRKLYIGRKVRELREANKATQASFAERIGISTSYLNQIENNQRPVSASVLLALAEKFQIDISEISQGDNDRLLSALTEALSDPIFENYAPNLQELKLVTQNAPGFARALISAHQAYRRNSEQLASLDDTLGRGTSASEPTPYEEVRDFFHFVDNYIHALDVAAERLAGELGIGERDSYAALAGHLDSRHGVRIARADADDDALRRFDAKSGVLFLNPYSPLATRSFQIAFQIAEMEMGAEVAQIARSAEFRTSEALEICKMGLRNYFAGALTLPYQAFMRTAAELRHDLELMAAHFGASIEQVAHRLSTLQRPGHKGVPIFFARIDRAGNITKRHSAAKLQFARFGAACPLWNVHQAFETPGRIIRQLAETPDGARYLCIATEISKGGGGFNAPHRRYAIALGCEVTYAQDFVYADGLELGSKTAFDPIGISCRICERTNCLQRAVPPLKRRLVIDKDVRHPLPYRIA